MVMASAEGDDVVERGFVGALLEGWGKGEGGWGRGSAPSQRLQMVVVPAV